MAQSIGYAHSAIGNQPDLDQQVRRLRETGCTRIYTDGHHAYRPALGQALAQLQPDDAFIVCRLYTLGRDPLTVFNTLAPLHARQVRFRSLAAEINVSPSDEWPRVLEAIRAAMAMTAKRRVGV